MKLIFQIQIKESLGYTSEEIISTIDEGKDLKLTKSVSVVFYSDFDFDNDEDSTEFEEKAES